MTIQYRDQYRYEGTLVQSEATAHARKFQYVTDGRDGGVDDSGTISYYTNSYTVGSPNPSTARKFALTLDDDLNPQHAIGEDGFFFRHSVSPTNSDLFLLRIDKNPGGDPLTTWPSLWWDHSESAFSIGVSVLHSNLNVYGDALITESLGIGVSVGVASASLLEISDTDADPVLTITGKHNTDYDPQLQFRIGATPAVVASFGYDATLGYMALDLGSGGISGNDDFVFSSTGLGIHMAVAPFTSLHIRTGYASGGTLVGDVRTMFLLESDDNGAMQFLGANGAAQTIYFGDVADNDIGNIQYDHYYNSLTFAVNTSNRMRIYSNGYIGMGNSVHLGTANPSTARLQIYDDTLPQLGLFGMTGTCAGGIFTINAGFIAEGYATINSIYPIYITSTLKVGFGVTAPTSVIDVAGDVEIGSANRYLLGDPTTIGSWQFIRSGNNLLVQRNDTGGTGGWVTKSTISA